MKMFQEAIAFFLLLSPQLSYSLSVSIYPKPHIAALKSDYHQLTAPNWKAYSTEDIFIELHDSNDLGVGFVGPVGPVGQLGDPIVYANFQDTLLKTGWGILDLETSPKYDDVIQAFTAGVTEGYLTARHIGTTAINMANYWFNNTNNEYNGIMPTVLRDFLEKQEKWTNEMVRRYTFRETDEPFWFHVGLIMEQLDGLVQGYHSASVEAAAKGEKLPLLERWHFLMLNAMGDMNDLVPGLLHPLKADHGAQSKVKNPYDYFSMTESELLYELSFRGQCSALVKVVGNDVLVGHSSWFSYVLTNRIFKHYYFHYHHRAVHAHGISFSSYPGFLESLDDFYMLSSNITWTQTSNEVLDKSQYVGNLSPSTLLAWQRVRVSSALAKDGASFYEAMKNHNSGTYSNQYIIVDLNKFNAESEELSGIKTLRGNHDHKKPKLDAGFLYLIEEMPGYITGQDITSEIITDGYFPSYNVPYFKEVYERCGYKAMDEKFNHSKHFHYNHAPRADIFRRDAPDVNSLEDLKYLLRYNDYKNDPLSFDPHHKFANPMNTICSRGDLIPDYYDEKVKPKARGCYDTKVTSLNFGAKERRASIVNGPTSNASGSELDKFSWKQWEEREKKEGFKFFDMYDGLPSEYDFRFVTTEPAKSLNGFEHLNPNNGQVFNQIIE